jgi:Mg2+-importing ATPase
VLAGLIVIATSLSEEEAFLRLIGEANPWWLFAALMLQAGTYLAQGEIWRIVGRWAHRTISLRFVFKLAFAKLFVDQALPSAGLSGTLVVAEALERGVLPRATVLAGIVVNTTSFFIAYVVALAAALFILFLSGHASYVIVLPSTLFIILSSILTAGMLSLTGRSVPQSPQWFVRRRVVQNAFMIMKDADAPLVRNIGVQVLASGCQLTIFLLDAVTLWALVRSLGSTANPGHVFASFMIANVVRTVSITPGGLGTFETAAVVLLKMDGVSVAAGLSAALLFRGLTFFLPMVPGLWFSRHLSGDRTPSDA